VSAPKASTVEVNGFPCRVWTKGQGPKLGFLAGLGGLPRWLPFLDKLAETHSVIEMAAIVPGHVRKLVLIAPFGLFDDKEPATDPWAQRKDNVAGLMCADGEKWNALIAAPEGANSIEWPIEMGRASEAAARAFWPLGNTRLEKRLGLIAAPTLILWGDRDAVLPPSYAKKFAAGINGAARLEIVAGAGHLAYLDQPDAVAQAVLAHFG
jgi:pimeloyl-ACP methyl ester carboxylesterase